MSIPNADELEIHESITISKHRPLSIALSDLSHDGEIVHIDPKCMKLMQDLDPEGSVSSDMVNEDRQIAKNQADDLHMPLPIKSTSGSDAAPPNVYNPKHKWKKLMMNPLFFGRMLVLILSLILLGLSVAYCIGQLLTIKLELVKNCTPKTKEEIWRHSYNSSLKKEYHDKDGAFIMNEESEFGYTTDPCWTTKTVDISTEGLWHNNQFYPKWDFHEMAGISSGKAIVFGLNALFCVIVMVYNVITMIMDMRDCVRLHTKSRYFTANSLKHSRNRTHEHKMSRLKNAYHNYFDGDTTGWIILHIFGELLELFVQSQALLLYGGYNVWDPHHSNDIYLANKPGFLMMFAAIISFNCFCSGVLWCSYALATRHCFGTVFTLTIFIIDSFGDLCYTGFPFIIVMEDNYNKNTDNVLVLLGQLHIDSLLGFVAAFMPLLALSIKSLLTTRSVQQALHDEYYEKWKCLVDITKHSNAKAAIYAASLDGFHITADDLAQNKKEIYNASGQVTLQLVHASHAKQSWIHNDDNQTISCGKYVFLLVLSFVFIAYSIAVLGYVVLYVNDSKTYCSSIQHTNYYDLVNGTHRLNNKTLSAEEIDLFETNPELLFWNECIYPVYAFHTKNRCQCRVFVIDWYKQMQSDLYTFNTSQSIILDKMLSNWIMLEKFRTAGGANYLLGNTLNFHSFCKLRAFEWRGVQVDSIHGISSCKRLEYLFFDSAAISLLPNDFGGLQEMKYLSFTFNLLKEVPASICGLTQLRVLQIEFEAITSIPHCLANLTELTELLIDGCILLSDVPLSLFGLPNLADLSLFKASISYESLLRYNMPSDIDHNDTEEWFNDNFRLNEFTTYWLALSPICHDDPSQYPEKLQSLIRTTCDYPCTIEKGQDSLCPPRMMADGHCDGICQMADCYNDGGDCVQLCFANPEYTNCSYSKLTNDVCDEGCNNKYCMTYQVGSDLQEPLTYMNEHDGFYAADNKNCEMNVNVNGSACSESDSIYMKHIERLEIVCQDEWTGDGDCDDACRTYECLQDKGDCEKGCLAESEVSPCFGLWTIWKLLVGEGIYKINHSYACDKILPIAVTLLDMDPSEFDCREQLAFYDWNYDSHINFREFVILGRNMAGVDADSNLKSMQRNCSQCSGVDNYNV